MRLDAQARRDGLRGAERAGGSPLVDRDKCNDKDKHVVTADTDQDKKPDVWKFFKSVDMGGQKTEVITCKQVDLNHDGKIDMVTYFDDDGIAGRPGGDRR